MPKKKNIIGERFGRLVVIEDTGKRSKHQKIIYKCLCDCGKTVEKEGGNLLCGDTKSCGCFRKDVLYTHGSIETRLYRIWANMLSRCRNSNDTSYKHYGEEEFLFVKNGLTLVNSNHGLWKMDTRMN